MRTKLTYSERYTDWYIGVDADEQDIPTMCHEGLREFFEIPDRPKEGDTLTLVVKKKRSKTAYYFENKGARFEVWLYDGTTERTYVVSEMRAFLPEKGWLSIEFSA
jgi:hypothetical protein